MSRSAFLLIALMTTLTFSLAAQQQPNYEDLALLRWYPANLTATFQVGTNPIALGFDGANMWVANYTVGTVAELAVNGGTVVGTFNAGSYPRGLVYDGANLWIANGTGATVTNLRALPKA